MTPDCFTGLTDMELSQLIIILLEKMHKIRLPTQRREGEDEGSEDGGLKQRVVR